MSTSHTVCGLLALALLTGCTLRQVAADHPQATRVILTTAATSAALTAAKAVK